MKIVPFRSRVLIRPDMPEEQTASGLFIGRVLDSPTHSGEVLAVGAGRVLPNGRTLPMELLPGDRVLYQRAPAQAVTPPERSTRSDDVLIDEGDVIAVLLSPR